MTGSAEPATTSPHAGGTSAEGRSRRRSLLVDALVVVLGLVGVVLTLRGEQLARPPTPPGWLVADLAVGAAGALALWWRRRVPVALSIGLHVVSVLVPTLSAPSGLALFTVAVHRPLRTAVALGTLSLGTQLAQGLLRPDVTRDPLTSLLIVAAGASVVVAWGAVVRTRRQLVASLAERVRRAEAEQELRDARARQAERTRIAREMHDVLAHRLSLLSLHAGALEFRPDAPPADIASAAAVVRTGAHRALEDLREVIGVLREDDERPATPPPGDPADVTGRAQRPPPTLARLPELLGESRAAGTPVELDPDSTPAAELPEQLGRHVYRIVQEGLTNARKHAPSCPVRVLVRADTALGVVVDLRNPLAADPDGADSAVPGGVPGGAVPGTGTGLVGIAERVALAGGLIEHGIEHPRRPGGAGGPDGATGDGPPHFRLHVWLPWPS